MAGTASSDNSEIRHVHGSPVNTLVAPHPRRVVSQHQQVPGQPAHRGEVVHVDEGLGGQEALIVLPGWTQDHRDSTGLHRIPQLLCDVVGVL
ncbi:hypothetical protein EYF80_009417 [Liparis tanakae]|uniref:Uncharacterized protein n=1 Tax=Liparis tanakae TaxID=230148 RepID=A0A4Z2IT87_9TELE|nr:hypothetical protein EYF80_009417 [Liparis tanakae]